MFQYMIHLLFLLAQILPIRANVEKTIFIAPEAEPIPRDASIDSMLLSTIHPGNLSIRTYLNASFLTDEQPHGEEAWFLLEGLNPGQRYEVRVCWLATQPTAFRVDTYPFAKVFETAELITSVSKYSYARYDTLNQDKIAELRRQRYKFDPAGELSPPTESSMLFLRIQAAADYFTLDKALMETVPPVHVDIILDAYLLNIFPCSLLPTAGYIVATAVLAWFLSGWIADLFLRAAAQGRKDDQTAEKKQQ